MKSTKMLAIPRLRSGWRACRAILLLALGLMVCRAQVCNATPVGTEFTYQGRLIDSNVAADGEYDFQFRLFDGGTGGSQVGGDESIGDVNVIDGYFTVELDFGYVFTGQTRWLEIGVREGSSSGDFTTLSPRQKITPVPYAIKAEGLDGGNAVVRGHLEGTCVPPLPYPQPSDPLPSYPFEFDISKLGDISPSVVNVVVTGYKFTFPGEVFTPEGALTIRWEVVESPYDLTLRLEVYDENGNDYDTSDTTNWRDKKLSIDFIASGGSIGSSATVFSGSKVVGGRISGTLPAIYPFEFDISELGNVEASDVMVVASGSKLVQTGVPKKPLMIKWDVNDSPLTVRFRLWDSDGVEFTNIPPIPAAWLNRQIEMSFTAFTSGACSEGSQYSEVKGGRVSADWPEANLAFEFVDSDSVLGTFTTNEQVDQKVTVAAVAWKEYTAGNKTEPLMVYPMAETDGTNVHIKLWVYDLNGNPYTRGDFIGDILKARVTAFTSVGSVGSTKDPEETVFIALNLDNDGNIPADYYGVVGKLYLKDLSNLKNGLGGSGITTVSVNDTVISLVLNVAKYSTNVANLNNRVFTGKSEGRIVSVAKYINPASPNEDEIYWEVEIKKDSGGVMIPDTDSDYKLITVEAHLD